MVIYTLMARFYWAFQVELVTRVHGSWVLDTVRHTKKRTYVITRCEVWHQRLDALAITETTAVFRVRCWMGTTDFLLLGLPFVDC